MRKLDRLEEEIQIDKVIKRQQNRQKKNIKHFDRKKKEQRERKHRNREQNNTHRETQKKNRKKKEKEKH